MEDLKNMIRTHPMSFRWKKISKYLQENEKCVDGLLLCDGDDDLDSIKIKILAVQSYLFRFEFINSVMVLLPNQMIFFSCSQKNLLMQEYKLNPDQKIHEIIFSDKQPIQLDFDAFFRILRDSGVKSLGYFEKEKPSGYFGQNFMDRIKSTVNLQDVSREIQTFLSVKETEDLDLVRGSSKLTCSFFRKLIEDIEEVIDGGKKVSHTTISNRIDFHMEKNKQKPNKWKLNGRFFDFAYAPLIQSNSSYSLKLTNGNSNEPLSTDCILLNVCGKYYEMNCLVVRTILVNPLSNDKRNYQALLFLQQKIISSLMPGERLSQVYENAKSDFIKHYPELQPNLPSSFGFGMGFEFKERCLSINPKNNAEIKTSQVYAVVVSLTGLTGFKSNKSYCMHLADTVVICPISPEVLTDRVPKNIEEIGYNLDEEVKGNGAKDRKSKKGQKHDNYMQMKLELLKEKEAEFSGKRMTRAALKREKIMQQNEKQTERAKHQKKLLEEKMIEIEERFNNGTFILENDKNKKINVEEIELYNSVNFPTELQKDEIRTDLKKWAILLPINDKMVPFHIALLKNVVKQSDGEFSRIRFNFYNPGIAMPKLKFPEPKDLPNETIYLQELAYRTSNHENVDSLSKKIKDLRKKWMNRDFMIDNSEDKMNLGTKISVLQELKMRPSLGGKKLTGTLEAYTKGYRFITSKHGIFELNHSNIRHSIFQTCDENMVIILHFNLYKAVQVGKKRAKDIQFYCEVGAIAQDLSDPRKNRIDYGYPDEMAEEEMERYMQKKYNDAFLGFVEDVTKKSENSVEFESPYIESSFYGSPFYNNVLISFCDRSLVSIVDTPLFVISLDDIEIVSIERIDNKIKNFDMIIIFKDYSRTVHNICNIPKSEVEKIRNWLDSKNILFFEGGKINLKWDNILKNIRENAKEFIFEEGGWRGFFDDESDDDTEKKDNFDDESSFGEEDLEEDEAEAYEDDHILDSLEDDEEEEEEFDEDEYSDDDLSPEPEKVKKKSKRGRKPKNK